MQTLLGSSKEAKKVVEAVQAFALKAPMLSVSDAVQSTQMLLGAGMKAKDAVPTMKAFSDTLSAMGRRPEDLSRMTYAFQQMMSKGKVTAEELRGQLGEIFPGMKLLAKGMGISVGELAKKMKKGAVTGMKPIHILLDQMEKQFGGATERSARTFTGQLNNMKENARKILGDIFKPLFDYLRDKIFPWVNKISQKIGDWAKAGGPKRVIDAFKEGFQGTTSRIVKEPGGMKRRETVEPRKRGGVLGVIQKAGDILGQKVLPRVTKDAKALWDALKPAEPFVKNILLPFVEGFAVGLLKGLEGLIPLIKIFAQALGWIGTKAKPLKKVFQTIGFVLGFVFGPAKIGIFRLFGKAVEFVMGPVRKLLGWLGKAGPVVSSVIGWFVKLKGKIPSVVGKTIAWIVGAFKGLGKKIPGALQSILGAVISAIVNFGTKIGQALGDAIWNALPGWARKLIGGGLKIGGKVIGAFGDVFGGPSASNRSPLLGPQALEAGPPLRGPTGPRSPGERGNISITPGGRVRRNASLPGVHVTVHSHINWKGREVASAVAEDTADKKARR
jgi:tape measure domain-containing protein